MKSLVAFLIALCTPIAILAQADNDPNFTTGPDSFTSLPTPASVPTDANSPDNPSHTPLPTPAPGGDNDPATEFTSAPISGAETLCLVPVTLGGTYPNDPTQPIGPDFVAPTIFPMVENGDDLGSLPSGAVCFQVYSTGGGVAGVPFTTIGVQAVATGTVESSAEGSATAVSASDIGGSSSSGSNLKVILPAVLGSVLVALLLVVLLVYFRKSRRVTGSGKDRRWRQRPGGWAQDQKNDTFGHQIPLKPQGPLAEPSRTFAV